MAKIYFVGDIHLQEQSPISRKDSYPTSILNKLTEIGNLVRENNIEAVIFSGDIFSTSAITLKYFKTKFAGVGLVVKLDYKLSNKMKNQINNYYSSMGTDWQRQNTNERIPNIGL